MWRARFWQVQKITDDALGVGQHRISFHHLRPRRQAGMFLIGYITNLFGISETIRQRTGQMPSSLKSGCCRKNIFFSYVQNGTPCQGHSADPKPETKNRQDQTWTNYFQKKIGASIAEIKNKMFVKPLFCLCFFLNFFLSSCNEGELS